MNEPTRAHQKGLSPLESGCHRSLQLLFASDDDGHGSCASDFTEGARPISSAAIPRADIRSCTSAPPLCANKRHLTRRHVAAGHSGDRVVREEFQPDATSLPDILPGELGLKLFGKEAYQTRADALLLVWWTANAVVLDHENQRVCFPENNPDSAAPLVGKCMLQCVGDQLVGYETERNSLLRSQMDVVGIDIDRDRPHVTQRIAQMPAQLLKVCAHLHPSILLRRLKVLVGAGNARTRSTAFSSAARVSGFVFDRA